MWTDEQVENVPPSRQNSAPPTNPSSSSERAGSVYSVSTTIQRQSSDERRYPAGLSPTSSAPPDHPKEVPEAFDEAILRGLCDMDGALPLLADRIKQSVSSCKAVGTFFKARAELEDKYGKALSELCKVSSDAYSRADGKAGTFVDAYQDSLKLQDKMSKSRTRFAYRLGEMAEELFMIAREGERLRKLHRETGMRYQTLLQDSEMAMEKAKVRFDTTAEELERVLVAKEGESIKDSGMRSSMAISSSQTNAGPSGGRRGLGKAINKFKGKGPASMARQEEEVRNRMGVASEAFRKAVQESQTLRQEYFNFQLPKIIRLLKECADEIDLGMQYHLARFAYIYESAVVADGTALTPFGTQPENPGLQAIFEGIDNRTDLKSFMQNYAVARGVPKGPRREGPYDEGYVSSPHFNDQGFGNYWTATGSEEYAIPGIPASTGATFGVDLGEQLARDGSEVPKVVEKCAEAIEEYVGLESMGIYRLSGIASRVQALKQALDRDIENTDVMSEEWSSDINVVASALKLWFRELPEPLLTYGLYHQFIEAARYDNDRLRHIRLHEQVNELPDANYATLKFFLGHLNRIRQNSSVNQMSISNLSIVFGPTLLGAPPEQGGLNLEHMSYQCKAIETILERYHEIFIEEGAESY
ncbi:GTPase activating protein [Tremella mesenterica]|uniref:GTPase activating protein n=1 Tax=Tremella mesenterica TaxID=5217 RepID=A0A4V1M303_TREME|nr:GTPase activating protein [Tremella mesenterica]